MLRTVGTTQERLAKAHPHQLSRSAWARLVPIPKEDEFVHLFGFRS